MGGGDDAEQLERFVTRARELALEAGAVLTRGPRDAAGRAGAASKGVRRELVTATDEAAERVVVGGLLESFPDHAVLAEEGVLTPRGKSSASDAEHVWVVDPLDGTTNFVHGLPYACVAIGLVRRGQPVVGVVHAPALGETYHAWAGGGAYCNGERIRVSATTGTADALLATGFSYVRNEPGRDDNIARLQRALHACRDIRRYGSAQLDLCLTARGVFDGYWELYLAPYDVIAGAVVVGEAGGRVTDLLGGEDWQSGRTILASNGHVHSELLQLVGGPAP